MTLLTQPIEFFTNIKIKQDVQGRQDIPKMASSRAMRNLVAVKKSQPLANKGRITREQTINKGYLRVSTSHKVIKVLVRRSRLLITSQLRYSAKTIVFR
jgi:hypothetical protein